MLDTIFSLPILSFLLIPTMSSYSTSLNILFFYLTWSTLVLSHPPLRVELVGTLAVRVIFFLVPSTVMFAFDALIPSAAAAMKAQGGAGLPIAMAKRKGEKRAVFKTVGWSLLNLLMSVAMQGIVEFVLTRIVGVRSALRVTTTLPMPWGIMTDLMWGLAGREVGSILGIEASKGQYANVRSISRSSITCSTAIYSTTLPRHTSPANTRLGSSPSQRRTHSQHTTTTRSPTSSRTSSQPISRQFSADITS